MQIIGKGGHNEYLVSASEEELAQIAGYNYSFPSGERPEVGRKIAVSRLWNALQVERSRPYKLKEMAEQLRSVAKSVDAINEALECPIIGDKP
jgi:hypothetical protein